MSDNIFKIPYIISAFRIYYLMLFLSASAFANMEIYIDILGDPFYTIAGKQNLTYYVDYNCDGPIIESYFRIKRGENIICSTVNQANLSLTIDLPYEPCILTAEAYIRFYSMVNGSIIEGILRKSKLIEAIIPDVGLLRKGIDSNYEGEVLVPIHWNIDDDDRSGTGSNCGEDYLQTSQMSCNDDDLLSIKAWLDNPAVDTSDCLLTIVTSEGIRLWYSQDKSDLCCDANSVKIINHCDLRGWLYGTAFHNDKRLYAECINIANNNSDEVFKGITFYCNNIKWFKLPYNGYAVTHASIPLPSERSYFEGQCELDGCEWGIAYGGGTHLHDRNSIAESVDPQWSTYDEPFVATTSAPLCDDIYTLRDAYYNTFLCRCISMDTFGNRDHVFDIYTDDEAFFTSGIWPRHYYQTGNYSDIYSMIVYYSGPFAARKASDLQREGCYGNWHLYVSRFFNKPQILHIDNQLESNRVILRKYEEEAE